MRRTTLCTAAAVVCVSLAAAVVAHAAASAKAEADAVRACAQLYIDGLANADTDKLEQAFHPDWRMTGFMGDGSFLAMSRAEFIDMVAGMTEGGRTPPPFEGRVAEVHLHGRAAVARIHLEAGSTVFTDFLSLLKIDGRWTIVNKIWDTEVKAD